MSQSFMFAVENSGGEELAGFAADREQIHGELQIINETQPEFLFNVTLLSNSSDLSCTSEDCFSKLLNEKYNEICNLLKYSSDTVEWLVKKYTYSSLKKKNQFFYLYDNCVLTDNLTRRFPIKDKRKADLTLPADATRSNLEINQTDEELVAKEINENQNNINCIKASLDILGEDEDDFWSMIEAGIGTAMDFSESVEFVKNWIEQNSIGEDSLNSYEKLPKLLVDREEVETLPTTVDVVASTIEANNADTLTDEITVNYSIFRKANLDYEVYFYAVDDINGSVYGLAPNDRGYVQAALNNIIFPKFSNRDSNTETGSLRFDAGCLIVPLVIEGGTLTEAKNGEAKVYFSYAGASGSDGLDRIKLLDGNVFGFKDLLDNTNDDFNDIVIELEHCGI